MTPRLTAPQMAVLRALDKLPEGEWITAKDGGFSGKATAIVARRGIVGWVGNNGYRLTPAGRALISNLKAEGRW